jgi:signal peptidase I
MRGMFRGELERSIDAMKPRGIIREFLDAFPAVCGPRFWPRARWLACIVLLLAAARSSLADWSTVPSGSMIPTLRIGDRVLVNKLAYDLKVPFTTLHLLRWADPQRGDVIVCFSPSDGLRLVKRAVGLPGDLVELRENVLYINGTPARYRSVDIPALNSTCQLLMEAIPLCVEHPVMLMPDHPSRKSFPATRVPQGKYFVMGDNRDESLDSRYIGFIDRSQIIGRANLILISLGDYCVPRAQRTLKIVD